MLMKPGNGETILVADDSPAILSMLCKMLEQLGYRVIAATDGIEAVDLFEQERDLIDLLLFDVMMPKMSGSEAALRIREQNPEVPLLLISGYWDDVQRQGMQELGDFHLISKPLSIAYLGLTINSLLRD